MEKKVTGSGRARRFDEAWYDGECVESKRELRRVLDLCDAAVFPTPLARLYHD